MDALNGLGMGAEVVSSARCGGLELGDAVDQELPGGSSGTNGFAEDRFRSGVGERAGHKAVSSPFQPRRVSPMATALAMRM